MPRGGGRSSSGGRSSGGSSGGFFSRGPTRSAAAPPRPAPRPQARPAAPTAQPQSGGGMMSGLGGTLMTGMAFGAGSEIAHQAVRGMMGSGGGHGGQAPAQQQEGAPVQQQQYAEPQQQYAQEQQNPCQGFNMNFVNCLKQNSNEIGFCQDYMNMLQQCERDAAMGRQNF